MDKPFFLPKTLNQFSAIFRCKNHSSRCQDSFPGNQRPILWQQSPLRENENIHEKPQFHEIWCGQSYLYMPYGTYGLGEKRASLIPLAEIRFAPLL